MTEIGIRGKPVFVTVCMRLRPFRIFKAPHRKIIILS